MALFIVKTQTINGVQYRANTVVQEYLIDPPTKYALMQGGGAVDAGPDTTNPTPAQAAVNHAKTLLRAGYAACGLRNYNTAAPMLALPALPLSTQVYEGMCFSDNGNIWAVAARGVTGAASPSVPANQGAEVTSGGATLLYGGKVTPVAPTGPDTPTSITVPTISTINPAMQTISFASDTSPLGITGSGVVRISSLLQRVCVRGPYANTGNWYGADAASSSPDLIGYYQPVGMKFGIRTHSARVGITAHGQTPLSLPVSVNGSPVREFGVLNQSVIGGGPWTYLLQFPDRRRRNIEWFTSQNTLDAVLVDAGEQIEPIPNGSGVIFWEGDSLSAGARYNPFAWQFDVASQVGNAFGIRNVWNYAIGGTGIVAPAAGATNNYSSDLRIAEMVRAKPTLIVIAGDHNDVALDSATRQAATRTYYNKIRAQLPYTPILQFGSNRLATEAASSFVTLDADLAAIVAERQAAGDTSIFFLPVNTGTANPWITDANLTAPYYYPTTDGHPVFWGIQLFAQRYISAIAAWAAVV